MPKALLGILFTTVFVIFAFLLGMVIGGQTVSTADGLAAGAIVFFYGVIGAIIALVAGIVLSIKLEPRLLYIIGLLSLVGTVSIVGYLMVQKQRRDAEKARLEEQAEKDRFRDFRFSVTMDDPINRPPRLEQVKQVYITQRGKQITTPLTDDGSMCTALLEPDESRTILQDIGSIAIESAEASCSYGNQEPAAIRFQWYFFDNDSPSSGEWLMSNACYAESVTPKHTVESLSQLVQKHCPQAVPVE